MVSILQVDFQRVLCLGAYQIHPDKGNKDETEGEKKGACFSHPTNPFKFLVL